MRSEMSPSSLYRFSVTLTRRFIISKPSLNVAPWMSLLLFLVDAEDHSYGRLSRVHRQARHKNEFVLPALPTPRIATSRLLLLNPPLAASLSSVLHSNAALKGPKTIKATLFVYAVEWCYHICCRFLILLTFTYVSYDDGSCSS